MTGAAPGGPKLYVHVGGATHFLRWELPELAQYFTIVDAPSSDALLMSFGPDVLEESAVLPAAARFAVLFPGFGHNPVHNLPLREHHRDLIATSYRLAFINPGPLQIAYAGLGNVMLYPFSVDTSLVGVRRFRRRLDSLIHVSAEAPQKDWERSVEVMRLTGLRHTVFPPRLGRYHRLQRLQNRLRVAASRSVGRPGPVLPPRGYMTHEATVRRYQSHDGFVHVARDVAHPIYLDGKYTATLIEAGLTGAILFWHDTFGLGNHLETVFEVPLEPTAAAARILEVRTSLDVAAHSRRTHEEMMDVFNPTTSVRVRAEAMLSAA